MKALDLAITVAVLGPALLLGADPTLWGLVLFLLPLHALALAQLNPPETVKRLAPWPLVLMVGLLPLELLGLEWALASLGHQQELPLAALTLTLWVHAGAFFILLGRSTASPREKRRLGVQAACCLPLPLAVLALAGMAERATCALGGSGDLQRLLGGGWMRLMLTALLLLGWRTKRSRGQEGGAHVGL